MAKQDPFYVLKMEIEESVSDSPPRILRPSRARPSYGLIYFVISRQVHDLKQKMTRYHGLQAKNPERKTLSSQVEAGCQSIRWQVRSLTSSLPPRGQGRPVNILPCQPCPAMRAAMLTTAPPCVRAAERDHGCR